MRALCLAEAEEEVALFFHTKHLFPQGLWIPLGGWRALWVWEGTRKDQATQIDQKEHCLWSIPCPPCEDMYGQVFWSGRVCRAHAVGGCHKWILLSSHFHFLLPVK